MEHKIQRAVSGAIVALLGALWGFPSVGLAFGAPTLGEDASTPDARSVVTLADDVTDPSASGRVQSSRTSVQSSMSDGFVPPGTVPDLDRRDVSSLADVTRDTLERPLTGSDSGLARPQAIPSAVLTDSDAQAPAADAGVDVAQGESRPRSGEAGGEAVEESESEESSPAPRPPRTVQADGLVEDPWKAVRWCESRDRYDINTGNGFYGAYQFTIVTWDWVAGLTDRADLVGVRPDLAEPADQDFMAEALAFEIPGGGLGHWPVCGAYYGT